MFECEEKGCDSVRSAGYWVVKAYIPPLKAAGHYCTFCHGFWPTLDQELVDPATGKNLRFYLAQAGLDPDQEDHKVLFIDKDYDEYKRRVRDILKKSKIDD